MPPAMRPTPRTAPTTMPAMAPVLRLELPEEELLDGSRSAFGSSGEVMGMMVSWAPWFQMQEEMLKVLRS